MNLDKDLRDPCDICLVRACCSELCDILRSHMLDVIKAVADDPNHEILKHYSEPQVKQIRSVAEIIKRNKNNKTGESND